MVFHGADEAGSDAGGRAVIHPRASVDDVDVLEDAKFGSHDGGVGEDAYPPSVLFRMVLDDIFKPFQLRFVRVAFVRGMGGISESHRRQSHQ